MQCIICEKPSAAKNYATALGGQTGTFNNKKYKIVNSVGHIFQLVEPHEQVTPELAEKYKKWNLNNLPWNICDIKWQKKLTKEFKDTYENIKNVVEEADEIVIATDDDPTGEGTLLADEILLNIRPKGKHYYRSFHVDESPKEIQKAMMNLKDLGTNPLKDPDYIKACFRSKWDYMSIQWTRVFSCVSNSRMVLRQGRLKSYMVWAVGEQIRLNNEYKKIPFYDNRFKDENGNVFTSKNEPQYEKKEDVPSKYETSDVVLDKEETKYNAPPALYDLNMLSASMASVGFTSKQVLDTYQKMYEAHIVSYPRTEDKTITPEQFNEFLSIADKVADVVGVDKTLLTHRTPRKTHVVSQGSHGANRPASNVPSSLEEVRNKYGKCGEIIYHFIANNSLAMLCEDYRYNHQTGHLKKYPDFIGYANIPISNGYRAIFNDSKDEKEDKPLGKIATPFINEGYPPKPKWPTAKWLAETLKKNDVGTGATRASIYGEVTNQDSKYPLLIQDKKGKITMAPCGEESYRLLKGTHIGDVKLTERLQEQMRQVAKGANPDEYLKEIENLIEEDIETVKNNAKSSGSHESLSTSTTTDLKCPCCGKTLKKYSWGYACPDHYTEDKDNSCPFTIGYEIFGSKLTEKDIKDICEKGITSRKIKLKKKAGGQYSAYLKYNTNTLKYEVTFYKK